MTDDSNGAVKPEYNGGDTRQALIDHLSREIEAHTSAAITFRARISLGIFLGPFVVLGAGLLGDMRVRPLDDWSAGDWVAISLFCAVFVGLGALAGLIESESWTRCQNWRSQIASLSTGGDLNVESLEPLTSNKPKYLLIYLLTFFVMLVGFLAVAYLSFSITYPSKQPEQKPSIQAPVDVPSSDTK